MSANDSILSTSSTAANNQQGLARALTGVVSTQETLARQYSILQTQLSSTKEEIRRDLNDLKNEVHRMGERTDRIVSDLIAAHAKQCQDLHSVISAQMSRLYIGGPVGGGVPSHMAHPPQQQYTPPQQQRPSQPMQAYANAMTAAQMFGGGQGGPSQQQLHSQQQQAAALEYASLVENFMAQAQITGTPQNAVMRAAQQQHQDALRVATAPPPPPPAQQPPLQAPHNATSSTNIAAPPTQNTQITQASTTAASSALSFLSKPQNTAQPVVKIETPITSFSTPTASTPMPIGAAAKPSLTQGMPTGIGAPLQQSTPVTAGNAAKPIVPSFFAGFGNKTAFNTAPAQPAPALSFGSIKKAEDVKQEVKEDEDDEEDRAEEYEPDVHFAPVIPLPEKVAVVTGEEEEKVEFEEKCKMYRYENKEWKERAIGILKVLSKDGKFRVVMRRDQVHKVAANFPIFAGLRVSPLGANEKAVQWKCTDFAEAEDGIGKEELLSVRFAGPATAKEFMDLVNGIANGASPVKESSTKSVSTKKEEETKAAPAADNFDKFKPKPGSWDCPGCYTNCGEDVEECPCCNTRRDGTVAEKNPFNKPAAVAPAPTGPAKFSFGFGSPATAAATPSPSASTTSDKPKASFLQAAAAATAAAATSESGTTTTQTIAPKAAAFGASLQSATSASPSPVSFSFAPKPTASSSLGSDSSTPSKPLFSFKTPDPSKPSTSMFGGSTKLFGQSSLTPLNLSANDSAAEEKSEPSAAKPATSVFGSNFGSAALSFAAFAKGGEAKTSIFNSAEKQEEAKKQFANLPKSKPFGSTSAAPPPKEKEEEEAGGEDEQIFKNKIPLPDDYEPNVEFKPVVPLPDLIDVVTGEENEEVKFTHRAKLYRFVRETKENKERGVGDIKLLYNPQTKKYRVVMRREQVHKLCANFPILLDTKVAAREGQKNVLSIMVTDFSESTEEGTMEVFLIKFKSEEQSSLLMAAIVDAQKDLMESSA